ncbi:MAG TPA: hypothetical protein VE990_03375 [Acidimicrobiales bacterium]|nr:hypothetical protein [Acidimicrobiales bacterium]
MTKLPNDRAGASLPGGHMQVTEAALFAEVLSDDAGARSRKVHLDQGSESSIGLAGGRTS